MSTERAQPIPPSFVAGHPVLDFVNTVAWRTDESRRADRVPGGATAWLAWASTAGLLGKAECDALRADAKTDPLTDQHLADLRELRRALGAVLDAFVCADEPPHDAWRVLHDSLLRARQAAALPPQLPLHWVPRAAHLADLGHTIALSAEDLLSSPHLSKVRRCDGPGCGWFFLDRTRSNSRRWCSSGDCGNRDRARRHYTRTRAAQPPPPPSTTPAAEVTQADPDRNPREHG